jgi:hypothetical protein
MFAQLPRCTGCPILPCIHQAQRHDHTKIACYLLVLKCYQCLSMVRTGVWWGHVREEDHLEDLGVEGRIILKCILSRWDGGVHWIDLAQDRAFVRAVMKLRCP